MDQKLFLLINREWTSPALDWLMATLSSLDAWMPVLCVLIVSTAIFGRFRGRAFLLVALLTVGLTDGVAVKYLKRAVNRPRPHQAQVVRVVSLQKTRPRFLGVARPPKVKASRPETGIVEGRSFPSGHTSDNFAVAVVLTAFFRRRGWIYFFFAAAVSYSRIYTGSHWPSDVLVSTFLGIGCGLLCVAGAEACWRRFGEKLAPALWPRHPSLFAPPPGASLS